jgi:hypothetical protein
MQYKKIQVHCDLTKNEPTTTERYKKQDFEQEEEVNEMSASQINFEQICFEVDPAIHPQANPSTRPKKTYYVSLQPTRWGEVYIEINGHCVAILGSGRLYITHLCASDSAALAGIDLEDGHIKIESTVITEF